MLDIPSVQVKNLSFFTHQNATYVPVFVTIPGLGENETSRKLTTLVALNVSQNISM